MGKTELKKAFNIGWICIFSYLANYYLRNLLSVATPQMLADGSYTKEFIGLLSSTYFLVYAAGQLLNGVLGDLFSPKKMAACGLFLGGAIAVIFPFVSFKILEIACFALFGFALSMMRGPLMKIISENTLPSYARVICVFFSFSSFVGPLIAGLFALVFEWKWIFIAAGGLAVLIALLAYVLFSVLERKGVIVYKSSNIKKQGIQGILGVFKLENFMFYMLICGLVEIAAASISFWIPTYLSEHLHFSAESAGMIFSAISLVKSFTPFLTLVIFRAFRERNIAMMRSAFSAAMLLFIAMFFVNHSWANIVLLLLALMSIGCASTLIWSIYIPSLAKTGVVSSVNGILDCSGYIVASLANVVFAAVIDKISWDGVILLWAAVAAIGVVATLFVRKKKKTI